MQTTDKNSHTYAAEVGEEHGLSYPISRHTLAGEVLTLPYNNYLTWMPVVVFGYGMEVDEHQQARLGELDNIWGNARDCRLLDPTYTLPLSLLNAT